MNQLRLVADWRLAFGTQLGRGTLAGLGVLALLALAVSAASLWRGRRRGHVVPLLVLRASALGVCLLVCLEPKLEFSQVSVVPNYVAVLMDSSRSMSVSPPDRGPTRAERAAAIVASAAGTFAEWEASGHRLEFYTFGETLAPTTRTSPPSPKAEATRIGEALSELRTLEALGAPVHTVFVGEKELRDLSVATVLADDFAFVRTPVKLVAMLGHSGFGGRMVDVSLLRDGRLVDVKTVRLRGDRAQETVTFDFTGM